MNVFKRAVATSRERALSRVLVLGDGSGELGPQTGAERQALALASALLSASASASANRRQTTMDGWHVRAESLSAVGIPMPRLFRPLPEDHLRRGMVVSVGQAYLRARGGIGRSLFPKEFLCGKPLPTPFNGSNADGGSTLIIAAGSVTSAVGCVRRHQLPGTKLVQLLHPRVPLEDFDVVVTPQHDFAPNEPIPPNVITCSRSLHDITIGGLAAHMAKNPSDAILQCPRPRIGVLLGGPRKRRSLTTSLGWSSPGWSDVDAEHLSENLSKLAGSSGSVLVTTSRRTPARFGRRLLLALHRRLGMARVLFDEGSNNDSSSSSSRSRYLMMLACSDALVVTPESVNMMSEATASNATIYLAGTTSGSSRLDRFVSKLMEEPNVHDLSEAAALGGCVPIVPTAAEAAVSHAGGTNREEREVDRVALQILQRLDYVPAFQ